MPTEAGFTGAGPVNPRRLTPQQEQDLSRYRAGDANAGPAEISRTLAESGDARERMGDQNEAAYNADQSDRVFDATMQARDNPAARGGYAGYRDRQTHGEYSGVSRMGAGDTAKPRVARHNATLQAALAGASTLHADDLEILAGVALLRILTARGR